jgi:serralysin
MTVGTTATGSIALAADVDWLRVNLLGGMLYRFDGRGSASGGGTLADPVMSLLNSSGAAIISDNNSGPGEDARIFYTAPASGAYYIAMRSASLTATGTYTVNATASPDDYTATTATTGAVTPGSTATGVVETAGDRDWFRTTLTAGTAYDIEVRGTAAGSGVRWTQSSLMMRDAGGAVVTSDTRSGVGAAARLFFTPASSGTYYIDALAYGTGVGSYSVSVTPASALAAPAIMEETEEASGLTASAVAAVTAPPAFDLGDYMPQSAAPVGNLPLSPFAELLAVPDLPPEDRHRLEAADLIHRLQLQPSSNPFLLLPLG